jgi:hypothetical protein
MQKRSTIVLQTTKSLEVNKPIHIGETGGLVIEFSLW